MPLSLLGLPIVSTDSFAWFAAGAVLPLLVLAFVLGRDRLLRPEVRRKRAAEVALLEGAEFPHMVLRPDGTVIAANAPARRRWSTEPPLAELARRLPPGDEEAAEAFARLRRAIETGGHEVLDIALDYDGRSGVEWLRISVSPVAAVMPPSSALPAGAMLCRAEEITARRAIDDVLRRDRDHLSDFLYFLPVGVYSADIDGRIRSVNQRFAEWLGWMPSQLTGVDLDALLHEGNGPEWDGTWRGVVTFRTRDGKPLNAFVAQDLFDDGGETRTRTAVLRLDDMAPPALSSGADGMGEHGEGSFRRLFECAPTALAVLDEAGCVEAVNAAFVRLMARPRGDLVDRPLSDLVLESDREPLETLLARLALGPATVGPGHPGRAAGGR